MGGKVQAMPGFADHVVFRDPALCIACDEKTCIAMCSGQAITLGRRRRCPPSSARSASTAAPACGTAPNPPDGEHSNIEFRAGSGGLHSAEN